MNESKDRRKESKNERARTQGMKKKIKNKEDEYQNEGKKRYKGNEGRNDE